MTIIVVATGYSGETDRNIQIECTRAFAESQGYEIKAGSEREVPDSDVDGNGIYRPQPR